MSYFSKEYLNNIWNNYIVSNSDCISFAAPFIFSRLFTPFKANEPISGRLIEGSIFSIVAFAVQYNVKHHNLEDYSQSYLPVFSTFVYHNIDSDEPITKFAIASISTLAFKNAIDYNALPSVIPSVITYGIAKLNGFSDIYSAELALSSGLLNYFISGQNNEASWGAAGGIIAQNMFSQYSQGYSHLINAIAYNSAETAFIYGGVTAGLMLSSQQTAIIEQLFAPSHFKKSYDSLTNFVDPKILNLMLEKHYITMANLQIGMGFYGNYLLVKMQEKANLFGRVGKNSHNEFHDYLALSLKYFAFASMYTAVRIGIDGLTSYNNRKLSDALQEKLTLDHLLKKDNFIQASKTNHTTQLYLGDVETISIFDNDILKWAIFGIPKLSRVNSLTPEAYAGASAVVAGDYFFNIAFQYLIEQKQKFAEEKTKCLSKFTKTNEHDKEYAVTILQKNALNYTIYEWSDIQRCIKENTLGKAVFSNMLDSFQSFYNQDLLYTGLHMLVALMSYKGVITLEELYLHTRTLETLVNSILFKSKNQASFGNIESSVDRINELFHYLNSANNSIQNINFTVNEEQESLSIQDLEFTRGNKEQISRVFIKNLELFLGKFYAITGANGSGKSSLATLLQYALEQVSDPSFNVKTGNITYPKSSIAMIPQKDFIPFKVNLFNLIVHPSMSDSYPGIEEELIKHINELQVFQNDITTDALYEVKEDWKDLSGGQKKKLFLIREFFDCPKVLIADEIFGPLDPTARHLVMNKIENSCLKDSLLLIVLHQDKNPDNTTCVKETFFDYELHLQNESASIGKVGIDCFDDNQN